MNRVGVQPSFNNSLDKDNWALSSFLLGVVVCLHLSDLVVHLSVCLSLWQVSILLITRSRNDLYAFTSTGTTSLLA